MSSVLEEMRAVLDGDQETLLHYGTKFHSGRYPYGSGEQPFQHEGDFLTRVERLRKEGLNGEPWKETAKQVREAFDISLEDYRNEKHWAEYTRREQQVCKIKSMKAKGLGYTAIGKELGISESTVRSLLNPSSEAKMMAAKKTADFLKAQVDKGGMLDVGKDAEKFVDISDGVERQLGVSRTKFDQAIYALEAEGYVVYGKSERQPTNPKQVTVQSILCPPGTEHRAIYDHPEQIQSLAGFKSSDGGETFHKKFTYPASLDSKRLKVLLADDLGTDGRPSKEKDGIIELRRGVDDLDLQGSRYAQVRILVDGTHYLKGMAVYSDNMPDGVDVVYNTSKTSMAKAMKEIKKDPENPFGSLIKDADEGGQYWYTDKKTGEQKLGLINKKSDQGDWSEWADTLPSQFLSKQSKTLAEQQLNLAAKERYEEYESICAINNPTIKKHFLKSFAEDCDGAAVNLKAAALPGQKYHAIIPINSLKDNEIYAPGYKDGTKLALVRYPHGGTFEIPILTVNNKNDLGDRVIGKESMDGVGITCKVAERLSGADFDGDTVMCIPTHYGRTKITSTPELEGLKGFDAKVEYATEYKDGKYVNARGEEVRIMTKRDTGMQMGITTNLITDMTLAGAPPEEMARAVRHSQVVIDAEKHKLDWKRSEVENNIRGLIDRYQVTVNPDGTLHTGGASTIISRAKSTQQVERRRGQAVIDPETGKQTYKRANLDDLYYVDSKYDKDTGIMTLRTTAGKKVTYDVNDPEAVAKYKPVRKYDRDTDTVSYTSADGTLSYRYKTSHQDSTKMMETDDARTLVSAHQHPMELLYADYANSMKALANKARKEMVSTKDNERDPASTKVYQAEVDSLMAKLNEAEKNSVRERHAMRLANAEVKAKQQADPEMSDGDLRKARQKAMTKARQEVGAVSRRARNIEITDREWEAIQARAISTNKLRRILANADADDLRQRATPRVTNAISSAKATRIKNMNASGNYTIAQIAAQLGVSTSTVQKYLKGANE